MDQFTPPVQGDTLAVALATNLNLDPANPNVKVAAQQLRDAHPGQSDEQLAQVVAVAAPSAMNMLKQDRAARPQDFETYNKSAPEEATPAPAPSPIPQAEPEPQTVNVTGKRMPQDAMPAAGAPAAEESSWMKLYKDYTSKFGAEGQKKAEDDHNSKQMWTDIINSRAGSVNVGAGGVYAMDALDRINKQGEDRTKKTRDQTLGAFDRAKSSEKEALEFGIKAADQERADKRLSMEAERMGMDKKEFNLRMEKAKNDLDDYYDNKAVIARLKDPNSAESATARESAAAAFDQAGMKAQAAAVRKSNQSAEQLARALPPGVKETITNQLERDKFVAEQDYKRQSLGLQAAGQAETRRHNQAQEGIARDAKEAAKAPKPLSISDAKTLAEAKGSIAGMDKSMKAIEEAKTLIDKANFGRGTGPIAGFVSKKLGGDVLDRDNARLNEIGKELVLAASGGKLGAGISNSDVAFLESSSGVLNSPEARKKLIDLMAKVQAERSAQVELVNNYGGARTSPIADAPAAASAFTAVPAEGGVFTRRGAPGGK